MATLVSLNPKPTLSDGITTIHAQIGSSHVVRSIREEIGDGAHQVFRVTHVSLGNQRRPVLVEIGFVVQDFLGPNFRSANGNPWFSDI